jgi:predicted alpha/beta superfamily hydrolase
MKNNNYCLFIAFLIGSLLPKLSVAQVEPIPVNNDKAVLLPSKVLGENRTLWVHLPIDYNSSTNTYPVLYLLDGDSHFKYTAELVNYLADYDMDRTPDIIVVGVVNIDRGRDLMPRHPHNANGVIDSSRVLADTGAGKFLRFLKDEVVPYINNNYRVQPYNILAGHSLAGLFAFYAKEAAPDLFQANILISPAINGVNDKLLADFKPFLKSHQQIKGKLFITIGNENTQRVDSLVQQLTHIAPKTLSWDFKKYEDENHFSVTYKSLFDGLKFIYKNWFVDFYGASKMSAGDIMQRYKQLSDEFGYVIKPTEAFLNNCGYNQMGLGNVDNAIDIFRQNVNDHPASANAYDSLGEAYMKKGETTLAIKNYEKSLSLNPDNPNGKAALLKLRNAVKQK